MNSTLTIIFVALSIITIIILTSKIKLKAFFALFIGVILALAIVRGSRFETDNSIFTEAIEKAGPVIIIVAAGGMFGMVIKTTGAGEVIGEGCSQCFQWEPVRWWFHMYFPLSLIIL